MAAPEYYRVLGGGGDWLAETECPRILLHIYKAINYPYKNKKGFLYIVPLLFSHFNQRTITGEWGNKWKGGGEG